MEITPIAYIRSDFQEKFGIPRQSGLVEALRAEVVFAPEYRVPEAVRGLEDFSHIWLIWEFSQARREGWSPTVRPPRLGGNRRLGVFATRAPFRPNALGLSAVRLEAVEPDAPRGPSFTSPARTFWTARPFMTSSRISPTPTPFREPPAALPTGWTGSCWRWTVPRTCWNGSRLRSGRPYWPSWPRTPGPPIRRTRTGYTAWPSRGCRCGLPWGGIC